MYDERELIQLFTPIASSVGHGESDTDLNAWVQAMPDGKSRIEITFCSDCILGDPQEKLWIANVREISSERIIGGTDECETLAFVLQWSRELLESKTPEMSPFSVA